MIKFYGRPPPAGHASGTLPSACLRTVGPRPRLALGRIDSGSKLEAGPAGARARTTGTGPARRRPPPAAAAASAAHGFWRLGSGWCQCRLGFRGLGPCRGSYFRRSSPTLEEAAAVSDLQTPTESAARVPQCATQRPQCQLLQVTWALAGDRILIDNRTAEIKVSRPLRQAACRLEISTHYAIYLQFHWSSHRPGRTPVSSSSVRNRFHRRCDRCPERRRTVA
jgi:hypothetical protein